MNELLLLLASPSGGSGQQGGSTMFSLLTFGLLFVVMYMFLIRPQSKKKKELQKKLAEMKVGDEIVSIGGIYGTVARVDGGHIIVKIDDNVKMKFAKEAISTIIPKESKKNISEPVKTSNSKSENPVNKVEDKK